MEKLESQWQHSKLRKLEYRFHISSEFKIHKEEILELINKQTEIHKSRFKQFSLRLLLISKIYKDSKSQSSNKQILQTKTSLRFKTKITSRISKFIQINLKFKNSHKYRLHHKDGQIKLLSQTLVTMSQLKKR